MNSLVNKRNTEKRNEFEHELQSACIEWFRLIHKKRTIFAIPNGGHRSKVEAGKLKKEGVLKGVSDLFIPEPSGIYHGMFAETKFGKNQTSKEQDDFIDKMKKNGYYCIVYWTIEEFIEEVNRYLNLQEKDDRTAAQK